MIRPSRRKTYPVPTGPLRLPSTHFGLTAHEKPNFVPYWNPEDYLRDLKRTGTDITDLEKVYAEHPPREDAVYIKKVSPDINTRPLEDLYMKYSKPVRKPPVDEHIKALHEAGYSEQVLLEVMRKNAKRIEDGPKLDDFIFNIFGDMSDKKTSTSTKRRTISQILKIKKRVFAVPEPDDEEIPVEDDNVYDDDCDI